MLDFLPPEEMTLEQAAQALQQGLSVAVAAERESDRTFYDTFDGLLHAAGLTCVHEEGRLSLLELDSGREVARAVMPRPEQPFGAGEVPDSRLCGALAELIEVRALLPLAQVHSRSRALGLLDELDKTVVRLTLEAPALAADGNPRLRPRLHVSGVRGYDRELEALTQRLESDFGFKRADQPLVDEAVGAAGRSPAGVSSKVDVGLQRGERAGEAAARVLLRLLEVIEANMEGTIANIDTEFLHDLRVAVRRTRSVQREFKRAFAPEPLAQFRAGFRWLQQVTGQARDLDVYILAFDDFRSRVPASMGSDLDPLLALLSARRRAARQEMAAALRSERTAGLLGDWASFLRERPAPGGRDVARPVEEVTARRVAKVYRRMVKMGRAIDGSSPAQDYHELRKKGKELRYLLELFATPLYPSEVVKPMVKTLKGLQDVLGRHQDREVQRALIRSLRDEVAALPHGPATLMAMGALVQSLGEDEQAARSEFAARFDAFAAPSQRAAVKETFR